MAAGSGFHEDYINDIVDAFVNYNGSGTRIYDSGNNPIFSADPYVALIDDVGGWSASIDLSGTAECSGGSYARQQAAFDAAASGLADNTSNIDFTSMPACTVYAVALCKSGTTATDDSVIGGDLSASKTVNSGDTFRIAAGALEFSITAED